MANTIKHVSIWGSLLFVSLCLPLSAQAASGDSVPLKPYNVEDLFYDFEVYIAADITVYRLTINYVGGNSISLVFDTLAEAEMYEVWLTSENVISTDITQEVVQGPWEYLITYDKRSTAEAIKAYAIALGYYAKVERVSVFTSSSLLTRSRP